VFLYLWAGVQIINVLERIQLESLRSQREDVFHQGYPYDIESELNLLPRLVDKELLLTRELDGSPFLVKSFVVILHHQHSELMIELLPGFF